MPSASNRMLRWRGKFWLDYRTSQSCRMCLGNAWQVSRKPLYILGLHRLLRHGVQPDEHTGQFYWPAVLYWWPVPLTLFLPIPLLVLPRPTFLHTPAFICIVLSFPLHQNISNRQVPLFPPILSPGLCSPGVQLKPCLEFLNGTSVTNCWRLLVFGIVSIISCLPGLCLSLFMASPITIITFDTENFFD